MMRSTENRSFNESENKVLSEEPIMHIIPQIPYLMNSFVNPNEITVYSSKDNLLSNPKSKTSSYLFSVKSKSYKSRKSSKDNKSNKSSFLSSMNNFNNINNKSKSSSFSHKPPPQTPFTAKNPTRSIHQSYDVGQKSQDNFFPSIYFSLNNIPPYDSPLTAHKSLYSLKNFDDKKHRDTKTIKRNLLIYSASKEKRKSYYSGLVSRLTNLIEPRTDKLFTNQQNLIFKDLAFFEEGLMRCIRPHKKSIKDFWIRLKDYFTIGILRILRVFLHICQPNRALKNIYNRISWHESHIIWDFMILILLGFYYIWVPIELAFELANFQLYLFICSGILLIISSFIKAVMLYEENKNTWIKNDFLSKYFKNHFILDLAALIFLAIFLLNAESNLRLFWSLGFLSLKFPESLQNIQRINAKIKLYRLSQLIFGLVMLFFRVFCFANLTACIWIYIGNYHKEQNFTWLTNLYMENGSISQISLYFRCLSVNFANITLIGLGTSQNLINPVTELEFAYNSCITAFGFLFLWYNWKCFSRILDKEIIEESQSLKEFERILKNYGLDYIERMSFTSELGLVLRKNKEQRLFGELLKLMSPSYQERLLMRIYWPIIKKMPVLSKNFTKKFLIKLLHRIKILTVTPNETIFQEGDYGNSCLYYLIHGEMECYLKLKEDEKCHMHIRTLKESDYFGEFSFFSNQSERFSVKCLTFSTLIKIDLQDFLEILKEFPSDYEAYVSVKERINSYNNPAQLYLTCDSCYKRNHDILSCPYLTYNPKTSTMYNGLLSSTNHLERRIFQRQNRNVYLNALVDLKRIEPEIIDFQYKYHDEIDKLLEEIYPASDNENSDSNQINDTSGPGTTEHRSMESKESQFTRDAANLKNNGPQEEFLGSPPSIFLQTPTKKSRKSMTESIFHEASEEDYDEKHMTKTAKANDSKTDKTLNDLDMENDEEKEDDEEYSEEDESEKKGTNKHYSNTNTDKEKESDRMTHNKNNTNSAYSQKALRSYQKFFSERESKLLSEKDTYHVLQNFDKMYKANNNTQQNTLTAQPTSTLKKNTNSYVGSYSISKSNSSSYPKMKNFFQKSSSSSHSNNVFRSTMNKKPQYNEYLNLPLFAFDFDKPREFKLFLPHNNLGEVINRVQIDGLLRVSKWGAIKIPDIDREKIKKLRTSNMANTSFSTKKPKKQKDSFETN